MLVAGIPKDTETSAITNLFTFGSIRKLEIMDGEDGQSDQALVTLDSWRSCAYLLAEGRHVLAGQELQIQPAQPFWVGKPVESKEPRQHSRPVAPGPRRVLPRESREPPKVDELALAEVGRPEETERGSCLPVLEAETPAHRTATMVLPRLAVPSTASSRAPATLRYHEPSNSKIFVGGLPKTSYAEEVPQLEQEVRDYFSTFGTVTEVEIKTDASKGGTGLSRGFCFVTFEHEASVEVVLRNYESHALRGKWIEVKMAQADGVPEGAIRPALLPAQRVPPPVRTVLTPGLGRQILPRASQPQVCAADPFKVFVGNLPPHCSEDELMDLAAHFGEIHEAVIMRESGTGKSRGFGFIKFLSEASVDAIIANHAENTISGRWVDVKVATLEGTKGAQANIKGGGIGPPAMLAPQKGQAKGKGVVRVNPY